MTHVTVTSSECEFSECSSDLLNSIQRVRYDNLILSLLITVYSLAHPTKVRTASPQSANVASTRIRSGELTVHGVTCVTVKFSCFEPTNYAVCFGIKQAEFPLTSKCFWSTFHVCFNSYSATVVFIHTLPLLRTCYALNEREQNCQNVSLPFCDNVA